MQGLQQLANLGEGLAGILVGDDDDQEDNESEEDEGEDVVEVRLAKYNIKLKWEGDMVFGVYRGFTVVCIIIFWRDKKVRTVMLLRKGV